MANDADYGLLASICTNNLEKAHRFTERVQARVVKVNRADEGYWCRRLLEE